MPGLMAKSTNLKTLDSFVLAQQTISNLTGQIINYSKLSKLTGISHKTAKRFLGSVSVCGGIIKFTFSPIDFYVSMVYRVLWFSLRKFWGTRLQMGGMNEMEMNYGKNSTLQMQIRMCE